MRILILTVLLSTGIPALAESPYDVMAWLTKRCWVGELPDGKTDQHCYGWEYGDRFIMDWHVVTGGESEYRGKTLYAWEARQDRMVYWYWTNAGTHSSGHMIVEGEVLVFPERYVGDDGTVIEMRNELRREGEDAYIMVTQRQASDGQWEVMWEVTYRDVRTLAAQQPAIEVPEGQRWQIVYNSMGEGNWEVMALDIGQFDPQNLSSFEGTDWVYAGGSELAAISRRGSGETRAYHLFRIDAEGDWHPVGDQPVPDSFVGRSPGQDQWVVALGPRGQRELRVLDRDGRSIRTLTDNDCTDTDPDWSPRDTHIVYRSNCGGAYDVWLLDLASGEQRRLTHDPANDAEEGYGGEGPPRYSPDGSRIAWMSWRDGDWEIWVMDADGGQQRALTDNQATDSWPSWSPDGRYIAFHSDREGDEEIYVMNADGTQPRRITVSPGSDQAPVWRVLPNG